jgi:hypothetical protein
MQPGEESGNSCFQNVLYEKTQYAARGKLRPEAGLMGNSFMNRKKEWSGGNK